MREVEIAYEVSLESLFYEQNVCSKIFVSAPGITAVGPSLARTCQADQHFVVVMFPVVEYGLMVYSRYTDFRQCCKKA